MRKAVQGFTIIELLVVIAIMAVMGVVTLANFRSFGEDKNLKNAILDIQSQLRTAQSDATSNVKCDTQFGSTWQVKFETDSVTTNINCLEPVASPTPVNKKSSSLSTNITIISVTGGTGCPVITLPFTVSFAPLDGKITIADTVNCSSVTITLQNSLTDPVSTRDLVIEQGGNIHAQ